MITKQQTFYFIIVLLLYTSNAQYKPCSLYLFDEIGCVSSTYEKCSWNDFLSACQQTESTNIGCSPTLNRLACINQLQYPNQDWAYCRFSGYCRQLTDSVGCSLNLSKPACLSVKSRSCQWTGVCQEMTDSQFQSSIIEAQNDVSKMNIANIQICSRITGIATAHQSGANLYINQLIDQFSTDTLLLQKYRYLLNISGCLQVDTNLLSIMTCSTAGLNQLSCQQITRSGEKCVYQNNQCQNAQDFSILNCSDIINKETCLSITNINQPCYWNNGCQLYKGSANCNTNVSPVSPSFCASINYTDDNDIEQECFYFAKKQRCNQLCRQSSLQNQKSCNSSSFGCTFLQDQCQFSNVKSQCGILGQNKYSCMRVNENCQFINGICKKITDLSISKCIDNLNQQACQNLTSPGQLCIYDQKIKQCKNLKLDFYQTCDGLSNVNENVCRRITDSACYWLNGNCAPADFKINCNARGLNRIGCLASKLNPCQWNKDAGLCQNVTVITNQTSCISLKLVNSVACRMVQYLENSVEQSCKYNTLLHQCETFVKEIPPLDTYQIHCSTLGLNKQGCLEVADPTIACKWTSQGCQLLTTITSACSGLINITPKACALVKGEICAYDSRQFRCTSSVEKITNTCNIDKQDKNLVINGKACAFIEPLSNLKCFFDQKNLNCIEATSLILGLLDCSLSFPNKEACLAISTPGQRCQWNIYKKQCEQFKIPTYDYCDEIENAGANLCIGYENNVQYYIDSTTYCIDDEATPHKCKQLPDTATTADCVFTNNSVTIKPNLHACVGLTDGQNCYFDVNAFECIKLATANEVTILNTILCKQANKDLCEKITTLDQFCSWEVDEKKCYEKNKCEDADQATCTTIDQPCGYTNGKCVLITSKISKDFTCEDANNNKKACMKVSGEVCKFDNNLCVTFTVQNTDDCSTYNSMKVNALSCASIVLDGAQCKYDSINNICVAQMSVEDECNLGQNSSNCLQENNCQFDSEKKICSKIISPCSGALNLIDCMNVAYYCVWKLNKCGIAPDASCLEYNQPNIKYNSYTCGSVYASDATKVCVQNPVTQQCEEIVGVKCSSTENYVDCKNIKNDCKWQPLTADTGKCITNLIKASKCTDNFTQYACLTGNLFCYWDGNDCVDFQDQVEIKCQTINGSEIIDPVTQYVSQELCFYNYCYLDRTTLKCTVDNSTPTECIEAISPFGCKSLDDSKYCYWDTDSKCKALTDLTQGVNLTYRQVSNSQQTLCLMPQNEGELTEWWEGQCYSVDSNKSRCIDQINIRACEAVINDSPKQQCIYKDSKCQYADLTTSLCTDTINIYTCVGITTPNQYCVWLGQKCSNLTDDGFTIGKYPSVNQCSCQKTYTLNGSPSSTIQNPIGVKFYQDGCILSDPENDTCDTPGLNYYGCLQTKAGACSWNGNKCVIFTDFNGKTQCSDYKMVSAGVCVQVPQLKCKWDNYNCIDASQNLKCTDSLSEQACISQKFVACKWENNKCQYQTIIPGVTQCGNPSASSSTAPISSIFSCQSVQFGALPCSHQGTGCTITLNHETITCNYPGLNDVACTYVKLEKCQFIDGKCQQYEGTSQQCRQLNQVSPQICADIKESSQNCKFSRLNNKCIQVYNYDLCTSEGINQAGCNSISACKWHKDQKQCYCSSNLIGVKFCADYDYLECQKQTSRCKWDESIQSCRSIQCSDLNIDNCLNSQQNNQKCYITTQNTCSGTNNCINAKNAQNCSDITINGLKCSQNGNYCRDQQCEDYLSDVQCNGKCYWTGSYCTKKLCQIFTRKEQCSGTYDDGTCYWENQQCFGIESCYSLMQIYSNDENLEQNCNKSIINNQQCYWQKAYQYSEDYECSHNQCKPLGSSQINCVGAEINNFVCILAHDFSCIRCEDLTNSCECGKYQGNCNYSNNKCNSIQCASYVEQSCALYPEKCIWHSESNLCLIICSKLDQNKCVKRQQDTKQCYWDSKLERCNNGLPSEIIIDTVSLQIESANITITQSSFDIQILQKFGIILLIILI